MGERVRRFREKIMNLAKNCMKMKELGQFFVKKRLKWCLKIGLYLENRRCYGKSNLIFGIYTNVSSDFCQFLVFSLKI